MTGVMDEAPRIEADTRAEWRAWLAANHATVKGAWLVLWKRRSGRTAMTYEDAVEEALCFGWIDGRMNRLDDDRMIQWFAPRRPRSTWARTNKERVERLEAAGLMTDAGRAVIAVAQANGSWNSLDQIDDLVMPADLEAALGAQDGARAHFDSRSVSTRRMALGWVTQVKSPAIRAARIEQVVGVCVRREPLSRLWPGRD
jgi:uncharacterized protein YdeI (YjbR/CyaY-like superfamily)